MSYIHLHSHSDENILGVICHFNTKLNVPVLSKDRKKMPIKSTDKYMQLRLQVCKNSVVTAAGCERTTYCTERNSRQVTGTAT